MAAVLIYSALRVASDGNLVHTVLWLGVLLATTAAAYVLLGAPFLATIQLILYTGGALTLMLFGVMLTGRHAGVTVPNDSRPGGGALILAAGMFGVLAAAIMGTKGLPASPYVPVSTRALGASFLTEHLLAFEVLSILLLVAMVGAIVIARKSDPAPAAEDAPAANAGPVHAVAPPAPAPTHASNEVAS